jgi:hypothetical protein
VWVVEAPGGLTPESLLGAITAGKGR